MSDMTRVVDSEHTIAAIATPPGAGGVGVIRISGPLSLDILRKIFQPHVVGRRLDSHRMIYGWIVNPATGKPLDEVMAVFMKAPYSYTREDVVEIQCHGSYLILQGILELALAAGAEFAEPGEFTKRAFLNGRIDLTRAEAVLELLQARTKEGLDLALDQLQGQLNDTITTIRTALITVRAILEVAIDFPDEDVEILDQQGLLKQLSESVREPLQELIADADQGSLYREGVSAVILGRPNVGKSSLLNGLLREERAIVTEIPGTTRDTIEEYINIKGMPVRVIDTAGIRETVEAVEEIGIKMARDRLQKADLVLLLVDATRPPDDEEADLAHNVTDKPVLIVINKTDLVDTVDLGLYEKSFPSRPIIEISAKTGAGIDHLQEAVFAAVTGGSSWEPGHCCVPNLRQKKALEKSLAAVVRVENGLRQNLPADLIAIEVQSGLDHLGDIIGETTAEDVLDMIFDQFCIGK